MNDIAVINPQDLMAQAEKAASVSKSFVEKTSMKIQGKRHVTIEGWQSVAVANGCTLGSRDVAKVEGGYTAVGELRRISDGVILATAEGFVGDDESNWMDKPEHAKRAMAQTRAMSRVGRSAFAHIVVMMGTDISTTPAEEMDGITGNQNFNTPPTGAPGKAQKMDFVTIQQRISSIGNLADLDSYCVELHNSFPNMTEKQKPVIDKMFNKRISELNGDGSVPASEMFGPEA